MRFEDAELNAAPPTTRIVIVCLGSAKERVRTAIGSVGRAGWEEESDLKLIVVHDRIHETPLGNIARQARAPATEVLNEVDKIAPPREAARIVLVDRIPFPILPEGDVRSVLRIPTIPQFETALPALLRQTGLDWMSRTILALEHYHQAVLDAASVQRWLQQFDRIKDGGKSKGWIGRALLKLLAVIPSGQVGDTLLNPPCDPAAPSISLPTDWTNAYKKIVCWETSGARSSALVSRYVSKRLRETSPERICSFDSLNASGVVDGPVLFLEDCLLTGMECIQRIKLLRPLIASIEHPQIDFRFAITTAVGLCRVNAFIQREGIRGIRILDSDRPSIENLTEKGRNAASAKILFDDKFGIIDPANNVINGVTLTAKGNFDSGQRNQILYLCRVIGEQLSRSNLLKLGYSEPDAIRIAGQQPLGLDNLGLVLAFAHGVPDGTLPLFWVSGKVVVGGETFTWVPLFPSVE